MRERDDTVDLRIVVEKARAFGRLGDEARRRGRAVHAGQDADIVARADAAVRPAIALERRLLGDRQDVDGLGRLAEPVVAVEIVHLDIVLVHPGARRDPLLRKADDLPELDDRRARVDRGDRHLVPEGYALGSGDAVAGLFRPLSIFSVATTTLSLSERRNVLARWELLVM